MSYKKPPKKTQFKKNEDAKIKGKKGGIKSGKVRRAKKTFQDLTKMMLDMPADPTVKNFVKSIFPNLKDKDINARVATIARQYDKAIKIGDVRSVEFLRDTAGEKPADKPSGNVLNIKEITFTIIK